MRSERDGAAAEPTTDPPRNLTELYVDVGVLKSQMADVRSEVRWVRYGMWSLVFTVTAGLVTLLVTGGIT